MRLEQISGTFSVCRLDPTTAIPTWATEGTFFSISRTSDELSIVCDQSNVPEGIRTEKDWSCLKVQGPLDFGLTGIMSSLTSPLAQVEISIFALSTFDTDYLLIKQKDFDRAVSTLVKAGHDVRAL